LPDPKFHAYRRDLADVALASQVIASHYAEPLERTVTQSVTLRVAPSDDAEPVAEIMPGELIWVLENGVGWAWGYAGPERYVGYVPSDAISTS
jgi:hypothetical protein